MLPASLVPERAPLVSEHDRVGAALMDLLHENEDRHARNVLVDPRGGLTLIDHDRNAGAGDVSTASAFFPGGGLAYAGGQRSASDLPPAMRAHVEHLAYSTPEGVRAEYGCTRGDAARIRERAGEVHRLGLDAALVQHEAEYRNLRDPGGGRVQPR